MHGTVLRHPFPEDITGRTSAFFFLSSPSMNRIQSWVESTETETKAAQEAL